MSIIICLIAVTFFLSMLFVLGVGIFGFLMALIRGWKIWIVMSVVIFAMIGLFVGWDVAFSEPSLICVPLVAIWISLVKR